MLVQESVNSPCAYREFQQTPQGGKSKRYALPPNSGSLLDSCALRLPGLRPRHKVSPNTVQQKEGWFDHVIAIQDARTATEAFVTMVQGSGCCDPSNALYGPTQGTNHLNRRTLVDCKAPAASAVITRDQLRAKASSWVISPLSAARSASR